MNTTGMPPITDALRRINGTPSGWLFLLLFLGLPLASPLRAQTADEELALFFKQYLDESLRMRPVEATALGDHRYDHLMDDISKEARAGWLALDRRTLKRLPRDVDFDALSRDGQVDYRILQQALRRDIWLAENTHPFEEDPRTYGRYISDSIYMLLAQSTLPRETNIANAIERMRDIPRIVATARVTLTHPPEPILQTAIRQNRGAIAFYEAEIYLLAGETTRRAALQAATQPVLEALKEHQQFLEGELLARATGDWRLGKRRFARKLDLVLGADRSADEVLADAEAEFDRVQREMYVVARQLWSHYDRGQPLPPDDGPGRREVIQRVTDAVSQEHGKPKSLLGDTRATVDGLKTFIREQNILRLPDPDRCKVVEMPEFRRGNSLAYLDNAPPLDANAPSYYAVSPPPADWGPERVKSFLEEYNQHMLRILTIHEAYPGHYVQLEYANRNPSLIRRVLSSGPYIEGWAVYTEQMMLDQGYGDGSLPLRMMQLKFYLRAVANAILDHRMHCTQMTDEEALRFLVEEAFQSEGEARLKLIRAKQSSTQLSTYFVGRMAHYRLRQQIERELGPRFELASYHEAVLAQGSIPVKYLPQRVRNHFGLPQ